MILIDEVKIIVNDINNYIKERQWFDFSIKQYSNNELILLGGLSLHYPDIEIRFKDIFFISLPMEWKTNTMETVMTVLQGEEERIINEKFQVEYLHYIFKFCPEDYPSSFGCLVAAKEVSFNILTQYD